jgi:hypothetical protein
MKKMSRRMSKRKRRTRKYKGGSDPRYTFWPQSIINFGRDSLAQTQNLINAGNAYPPVVSPNPMNQPINKNIS